MVGKIFYAFATLLYAIADDNKEYALTRLPEAELSLLYMNKGRDVGYFCLVVVKNNARM